MVRAAQRPLALLLKTPLPLLVSLVAQLLRQLAAETSQRRIVSDALFGH